MTVCNTKVTIGRPHVVFLGAGASLAAFPNGDANGLRLPVMSNFIETIYGLSEYLQANNIAHDGNIENLYSDLIKKTENTVHVRHIEALIYDYFSKLSMPDEPTLYDHLLLSLRNKDAVATFNWDPFLYKAFCRLERIVGLDHLPRLAFLHGSVATGFCQASCHEVMMVGPAGRRCKCGNTLTNSPLLYPIDHKNYATEPFINASWHDIRLCLEHAYMLTIFGYSAPSSDVEAVRLMQAAWGEVSTRNLEQVELIDVLDKDTVSARWAGFIHTHHYMKWTDFYDSYIARYARRSCDAFWDATMMCAPHPESPICRDHSWEQLRNWVRPFLEAEISAKAGKA